MLAELKPYPNALRAVPNEPWLGRVPAHWGTAKLKHVLTERNERGFPAEPLLAATQTKGVVLKSDYGSRTVEAMKDLHLLKLVRVGDFVISLRSFQGGIEFARTRGIISPAYTILHPRDSAAHGYLAALFKSRPFIGNLTLYVTGIRQGQNIDYVKLGRSSIPLPPPAEQAGIVLFLGAVDRKVNRFIRAKRRLIEVLTEQKQAIITHAVTKGLSPHAPGARFKPSGIDWLGDVPAHWEVLPFVRCTIERADYRGATPEKVESGTYLVTAKNIRKGWIDYETSKEYVRPDQYERIMRRGLPKIGDVLFTTEAPLGHVALVDREDVALAQRIIRFRLDEQVLRPRFALAAMLSQYFQTQLELRATGSTASGIKASKLPQLQIVKPPTVAEQDSIVEHVDRKTADINHAISDASREISLIREYRTRLVADVVTGKVDVRAAAASLPDEPAADDPTPDDDAQGADAEGGADAGGDEPEHAPGEEVEA